MGDVAAARTNWRPLTVGGGGGSGVAPAPAATSIGSNGNGTRDFLSEQRRQMAEIERLKTTGGGAIQQSRNAKSQSVLPPSGTGRPINHLEVNKMAQVCKFNFDIPTYFNLWTSRPRLA